MRARCSGASRDASKLFASSSSSTFSPDPAIEAGGQRLRQRGVQRSASPPRTSRCPRASSNASATTAAAHARCIRTIHEGCFPATASAAGNERSGSGTSSVRPPGRPSIRGACSNASATATCASGTRSSVLRDMITSASPSMRTSTTSPAADRPSKRVAAQLAFTSPMSSPNASIAASPAAWPGAAIVVPASVVSGSSDSMRMHSTR